MNKKRIWSLIALPGLAISTWLLAFFLLSQSPAGAARDGLAEVINVQSPGTDFTISGTVSAIDNAPLASNLQVCGDDWILETVDSAGDVGRSTSLALEPTDPYTPHISYRDVIAPQDHDLKYAWLGGTTWLSETVDSGGDLTSLALVPTYPYTACVAYSDVASPNFWEWLLRYACRDDETWTTQTISSNQRAGQDGLSLALEPIYPFTPHISYYMPWGTERTLYHTYLSGTTWMSGTWRHKKVEPSLSKAGPWNSLALESGYPYTAHISYYDTANDDLRHAWMSDTTWLTEPVDIVGDVGWYTSLALDSGGNPHISYFDNTNDALKYARWNGTTWLSGTVDSIGEPPWGSGTSLDLNQADVPYISYYDAINDDLRLAYLSGTVWITEIVDSEGDVGSWSSLALDQVGCPHISYYDATNGNLKYAYLGWVHYLPLIFKNY